jgi:hypothetical protein
MQTTIALFAAVAAVAQAAAPAGSPPAGFATSYPDSFQITAVNSTVVHKRDLSKRAACPTTEGALVITLKDGVLTDTKGRIADIVANYQFQFDPAPGQPDAVYTSGFSVGSNSSLALGSSAIFWQCLTGNFYNLYSQSIAPYCEPVLIDIIPCGASSAGQITEGSDGQPAATTAVVSQVSDGQPQEPSAIVLTQISDGQVQVPTGVISQISDGQIQAPTTLPGMPISQISDGQVQAPTATGAPITQISDGQVQAPTATPVSQISDGQVQAPTGAPITQISDGQVQAPTGAPITQISDGQVQAPTGTPISQISDGQIQAPTTMVSAMPSAMSNGTGVSTQSTPSTVAASGANALFVGSTLVASVAGLVAFFL